MIDIVRTVDETLDRMHIAASEANLSEYFDCFTSSDTDGYFIGTDADERWTIHPEFYNYTKAYFDQGMGWTYTSKSRHITYLKNQNLPTSSLLLAQQQQQQQHPTVALFDELLHHERFGTTRNSGVLVLQQEQQHQHQQQNGDDDDDNNSVCRCAWKIIQYHLTIPIPNRHVDTIVQIIQSSPSEQLDE